MYLKLCIKMGEKIYRDRLIPLIGFYFLKNIIPEYLIKTQKFNKTHILFFTLFYKKKFSFDLIYFLNNFT